MNTFRRKLDFAFFPSVYNKKCFFFFFFFFFKFESAKQNLAIFCSVVTGTAGKALQQSTVECEGHGHPLQPKMFSSCDALPYHWNPTSLAEIVGLPLSNGSTTLNTLSHTCFLCNLPTNRGTMSSSRPRDHHEHDGVTGMALEFKMSTSDTKMLRVKAMVCAHPTASLVSW